jgi:hypothetical protein
LRPHKGLHPHLEALKQKSRIESKRGDDAGLLSLGRDLRYSKKLGRRSEVSIMCSGVSLAYFVPRPNVNMHTVVPLKF